MNILLVSFVVAYVAAAPFEEAVTVPAVQFGLFRLPVSKPAEGTSSASNVLLTETVGTVGTKASVIPTSTTEVGQVPTAVFIQQPLPVFPAPVPYLIASHVVNSQAVIPPCFLLGDSTVTFAAPLPPKAPIRETYTYVAGASGSLLIQGGLAESHKGSLSVDAKVPQNNSPVTQPAVGVPEIPIVSEEPSTPTPIVSSPHSVYGVPDLYTSTTFAPPEVPSGPYPARSDSMSHYGESLQVPPSLLRQGF